MLRARGAHLEPTSPPEPVIPWFIHAFRPRIPPATPYRLLTRQELGAAPEPWPTQCRDCWGWVDDPRHLSPMPLGPLE